MATSNFKIYNDLPGIYFMSKDEIEAYASQDENFVYDPEEDEEGDGYYDALFDYIDKYWPGYVFLDESNFYDLQKYIDECNDILQKRACRLYESPRCVDSVEYDNLRTTKITIESGHYMGYQIAVEGDYKYLNKTSKKLVRQLFMKIAKKFDLPIYALAYRFSNGETGFIKIGYANLMPSSHKRAMG